MIIAVAAALAAAGLGAGFALEGIDEAGLRLGVRTTARIGGVWLCVVFATSALNSLFRSGWSRWLLRNRRDLGLGFAAIHGLHGVMFLWLGFAYSESFWTTTPMTSVVGGSVGYVVLLAMTITSFDGPTAALGRRAWKALHKIGIYVLWAIFVFSNLGLLGRSPIYAALLALLLAAWGLRLAAFARRIRRRRAHA